MQTDVLIIGGGCGGLETAIELRKQVPAAMITLVNPSAYLVVPPFALHDSLRDIGPTTASASRRKVSVKNMFQRIHRDVYSVIIGLLILAGLITLLLLRVNPIV